MKIRSYIPFYKRNLLIALPVMLAQLGQVIVAQADNMMVGHVGTIELAAASFANSVFIVGMVFGMGFSFGLTPLVGESFSKKLHDRSAALLQNSINSNILMTVLLTTVMWGISWLFPYMNQPEEVVQLALPYYRLLVISLVPFMLFFSFKQFAEGIGNTVQAMLITLGANLVNIGLNALLIFGLWGFPRLELEGAGWATLISRILMPIGFAIIFYKHHLFRSYFQKALKLRPDKVIIKQLMKIGLPISLQMVLEVSAFALSGIMMGWLGSIELAAHQIALGLASMTFMIVSGISSGTTIRVSHQYNSGNIKDMHKAAVASIHLVIAFMSFTAISFVLFRNQLPFLYTKDEMVITLASQLLLMAAVFQLFDGVQVTLLGVLRGLTDVKPAMLYALIAYILINLPLAYYLAFVLEWGAVGVWVGFVFGLGVAALLFYRRYIHLYRRIRSSGTV